MMFCLFLTAVLSKGIGENWGSIVEGPSIGRVSSFQEDKVTVEIRVDGFWTFSMHGVKTYDLVGRPLPPTEPKNRLRLGGLILFSKKGMQSAWRTLGSNVLFLPSDTLIVVTEYDIVGFPKGWDWPSEPISCTQTIRHALIDRPMELTREIAQNAIMTLLNWLTSEPPESLESLLRRF